MRTSAVILALSLALAAGTLSATGEKKDTGKPVPKQKSAKVKVGKPSLNKPNPVPSTPPRPRHEWTIFQIGFLPLWPNFTKESNVYGIKLGIPMCSGYGRVYGVEPSVLYSGTRYVCGIQATFLGSCLAREIYGIQASSFGPSITTNLKGLQAVGTLGMAETVKGAQIAPVTMVKKNLIGIQFGAVNLSRKSLTGCQGGAVNVAKKVRGLQLGVFNYSDGNTFQIGGINIIKNGWLPFMIGINFKF